MDSFSSRLPRESGTRRAEGFIVALNARFSVVSGGSLLAAVGVATAQQLCDGAKPVGCCRSASRAHLYVLRLHRYG